MMLIVYIFYEIYWKRRRLPPGPTPWLLAGNIPHFLCYQSIDDMFLAWKQKYGGVNGVVQIDGDKWREQRRFSLHVLRDFGLGRALMEQKIQCEVTHFVEFIEQQHLKHQQIDICQATAVCVGNIINNILFGHRFAQKPINYLQGSEEFHKLHSLLDEQSRLVINPMMGAYIVAPILTRIPFLNKKWKHLLRIRQQLWSYLDVNIEVQFHYHFIMKMLLLDLFFAGMETTVTTMKWGFLMVLIHPEVQTKIQEELDECDDEIIKLSDRNRCPYTMATLNEIQRIANILPINLLRTVAEDKLMDDGYFYPAGTLCIPQISIAMNDPENFTNPQTFCPERFLENDGETLKRYDAFMPFSIGKRQCLGESLARAELFLIFANALHNFRFRSAVVPSNSASSNSSSSTQTSSSNSQQPSTKRLLGLTVSPPSYKCVVERRQRRSSHKH
ncbi:unnamed protein product [Anisakis simplex]|uniref:Cytochrome P450 n=1 Tax=Anisakis simplex TaxID=6269 RepID=A0A0M3JU21_ANISI|nr:unnamed protein product [Anisakis simplex]